jgi:hypothetical protein
MSKKTEVNTIKATDIINQADKIFGERKDFEEVILARSNEALYKILADVYALYKDAAANEKCMKESISSMRSELKGRGIVTQSNTPRMTVFVRYIFNSDRKRSYNYTQTLLAADAQEVDPKNLADFITNNSGVEEIKRKRKVNVDVVKQKAAVKKSIPTVKSELESMPTVATVKLPDSSVDLSDGTQYVFIIARKADNGEMELLRTVPKTTVGLENLAFKALAEEAVKLEADKTVIAKGQAKDLTVKASSKSVTSNKPELEAA